MHNSPQFTAEQIHKSQVWFENEKNKFQNWMDISVVILFFRQLGTVLSNKYRGIIHWFQGVIIHQQTSRGNTLRVEIQLDKGCPWLLELETLIPLEQYWPDHYCYSSHRNCEEEPLVMWVRNWNHWGICTSYIPIHLRHLYVDVRGWLSVILWKK